MRTLARWCCRHWIITIVGWVALVVVLVGLHSAAGSAYTDKFTLPHTQSSEALKLLQRADPNKSGETDQLTISVDHGKVTDPAVRAQAEKLFAQVAKIPHVAEVISPYTAQTAKQIAPDGSVAFADVVFDNAANNNQITASQATHFDDVITSASTGSVQFNVEGNIAEAGNKQNSDSSLFIGFIAAAIVLFLAFGSVVAMFLPLITAGISLGAGTAVIGLLSHALDIASFSSDLALLIGLGVGVDYALFIVTRFRQASLRGVSREDAVVEAIDTSGRAVLFAGMIVVIAMLGMFALGISFLYGVAVAAAVVVAFTVIAALTLLPALLGAVGGRVPRRRERRAIRAGELTTDDESPLWARWTRILARRPAVFASLALIVMIIFILPFFHMRLGSADAGTDPSNTTTRHAYDALAKGFGPGYNGPLELVAQVRSPAQTAAFTRSVQQVAKTPGVVGSTPVRIIKPSSPGRPTVAVANVYPSGSPQAKSTTALLNHIRDTVVPAATRGTGVTILVGGTTAIFEDFANVLSGKLPLFIGIVVVLSFLLLMMVFRSLLIPLTASIMNLLSVGAAFGVLTAIFQDGIGNKLIGLNTTGPIESFIPVLLFPILFGLSMDYEVFLITRIFEEWHRRGDTKEAVMHGLAATGRTITAAAGIMFLVFASFVLGGEWVIEMFGVGLAAAVLLDAVVVRMVLVPGVTILFGEWNWKIPAWLDRILPHVNVEGKARPLVAAGDPGGSYVEPNPNPNPNPEPEPAAS
jgi:RND superfamily putative drug exporter